MSTSSPILRHSLCVIRMLCIILLLMGLTTDTMYARKKKKSHKEVAGVLTQQQQQEFDSLYYQALIWAETEKIDSAFHTMTLALKIDSLSAAGWHFISQILYRISEYKDSYYAIRKATAQDSTNLWYGSHEALLLGKHLQRPDKAIEIYERLIKLYPKNADLLYQLSAMYVEKDDWEGFLHTLKKLENLEGLHKPLAIQMFRLLQELNRSEEAFETLDRLIKRFPSDASNYILLGDMQMQYGQIKQAEKTYRKASDIDPDNVNVWNALANHYFVTQKLDDADTLTVKGIKNNHLDLTTKTEIMELFIKGVLNRIKEDSTYNHLLARIDTVFNLAREIHPTSTEILHLQADYLAVMGETDETIEILKILVKQEPMVAKNWQKYLAYFSKNATPQQLLEACQKAIEIHPKDYKLHLALGNAYAKSGQTQEELKTYQYCLTLVAPEEVHLISDLWAQIGTIYHQLKNMPQTYAAYDAALKYNANNYFVLNNYAYFLSLENRDLLKAESMQAKVIQKHPEEPTYLDTYAWIYFQQGNYILAKFYQERALSLLPDSPPSTLLEHYGDILMMYGDKEKALEYWQKALAADDCENAGWIQKKIDAKAYIPLENSIFIQ